MTEQGLQELGTEDLDLVVLENVGNLVCPAEFDTGAVKNAMILSVPEGHDKPLKYPLIFTVCDALIINKIDVLPYFDFDMDKVVEYAHRRNPNLKIFPISAKSGLGVDAWRQSSWRRPGPGRRAEPIDSFSQLFYEVEKHRDTVLVTLIDTAGSAPRKSGSQMLVGASGRLTGTIGGGAVERRSEADGHGPAEGEALCRPRFSAAHRASGGGYRHGVRRRRVLPISSSSRRRMRRGRRWPRP